MTSRMIPAALLPIAMLATLSCSKTQDTAPERRVFGDPPLIKSVEKAFFNPKQTISCDFTAVILEQICYQSSGDIRDSQAQPGDGWTEGVGRGNNPTGEAGVFIQGTYGEAIFSANVTDPNSTTAQNNLLLVSASYVQPESTSETSLVLFDDGAFSKFRNPQKGPTVGENCPPGSCSCSQATYNVTSGDEMAADDHWTRKIALYTPTMNSFLQDCIMRDKQETLILAPGGSKLTFKIEAVDRQGNLTTFSDSLVAQTDTKNEFTCNGDSCGCCFLHFGGLSPQCNDLPGMISSVFPTGLCKEVHV